MFGHIYINAPHGGYIIRTDNHEAVYNAMLSLGFDHEEAADVADWAELAGIGEEYSVGTPALEIHIGE